MSDPSGDGLPDTEYRVLQREDGKLVNSAGTLLSGAINGAWTAYTPTVENFTDLGDEAVTTASYVQIGRTVIAEGFIKVGSTNLDVGSGTYGISLPVACTTPAATTRLQIGTGSVHDATNGESVVFGAFITDEGADDDVITLIAFDSTPADGEWAADWPQAPASGDMITWHVIYEAAAAIS